MVLDTCLGHFLFTLKGPLNSARYISGLVCTFPRSLANRKSLVMVAEQLARHHTPVTTVDELWHRVEAAWASEHVIQSVWLDAQEYK
ncbi:hypothetical protein TNCV_2280451 [Trichonephila clavipes]|nr:hypothetical protein TNCV_2280451 [Trichonephila clavipes]